MSFKPFFSSWALASQASPARRSPGWRAKGKDIQITEYPGASHVFDGRAYKPPVSLAQAQTTRHCTWQEGEGGQLLNAKTRQPYSYSDPCVERGVTIAYDEKAAMDARKAVAEFLAATFNLH
jgi:dienelactone hydrolase